MNRYKTIINHLLQYRLLTAQLLLILGTYTNIKNLHRALHNLKQREIIASFPLKTGASSRPKNLYYLTKNYSGHRPISMDNISYIQHLLSINSFIISLKIEGAKNNIRIDSVPEHSLNTFSNMSAKNFCHISKSLICDAAINLSRNNKSSLCFLEVDFGERQQNKVLISKFNKYAYQIENFKETENKYANYWNFPYQGFRVLYIVQTLKRKELIQDIIKTNHFHFIYIATQEEAENYPLDNIYTTTTQENLPIVRLK